MPGSVLASQDPAVPVLSALEGLTVVFGMGTGVSPPPWPPDYSFFNLYATRSVHLRRISPRPIRIRPLHTSLCFHAGPIDLVFFKGSYLLRAGHVISRGASRLDAFSAYPFPTWLPSAAPGGTTGTPAVGSSRSSRTKDDSSHISYARGR